MGLNPLDRIHLIEIAMGKIFELSQHVANQIAAGEVIERPSSVIKELVENALDAQAQTIEVRIKNGGFDYVVVHDDGSGMDEEDVCLSIKRFATSKLKVAADLDTIQTFGFRGEALPSIASVSRMWVISRTAEQAHATKVCIEAGEIKDLGKAGANKGTRIEVRDLFFNVPARLKFAKSKRAETAEIDRLMRAFAFVYSHITWRFFVDDKLVFSCAHDDSDEKRALHLLGKDCEGMLYAVNLKTDVCTVTGFVTAPMAAKSDARGMHFFVNDRLIGDKKLVFAVKTAYRSLLEVGQSPVCALKISMPTEDLDVNVHPRKAEVRFRDERALIGSLINALGEYLAQTPWLKTVEKEKGSLVSSASLYVQPQDKGNFNYLLSSPKNTTQTFGVASFSYAMPAPLLQQKKLLSASRFSDLRVVGQIRGTYLLTESEDGLVIIDQHAAHERVMFERIRKQRAQTPKSISLLIPISVELSFSDMNLFEEYRSDFEKIGIDAERFGDDTVVVRAVPDFIANADVKKLVCDLLWDLSQHGRAASADKFFEHVCATLACHGSIRAGQKMTHEEIRALLEELDGIEFAAHCPHGRPIVKSFLGTEIKKWFDRP